MQAQLADLLDRQLALLVEKSPGDERLADVMQQRGARQAPLVVLAHAEMLREGDRKAGDVETVTVGVDMVAADRRQPFAQGRVLDGLENLLFGANDTSLIVSGSPAGSRSKILTITSCAAATPAFSILPRSVASKISLSGNAARMRCSTSSGSNGRADRVGGAERPGLHRGMVQRFGQHEQPRHAAIGAVAQLVADPLHALRRTQVDVDHHTGEIGCRGCRESP